MAYTVLNNVIMRDAIYGGTWRDLKIDVEFLFSVL